MKRVVGTDSTCLEWQGRRLKSGYGVISVKKNTILAHRAAWELMNGPIPEGLCICHRCDNPPCVNTDHLFLGTHADNTMDKIAKGRARNGASPGVKNGRAKLTEQQVNIIRELQGQATLQTIADVFGVSKVLVGRIHRRLAWKHI